VRVGVKKPSRKTGRKKNLGQLMRNRVLVDYGALRALSMSVIFILRQAIVSKRRG